MYPSRYATKTSCARGDTICLRDCKLIISSYLFARWHLFRHVGYLRHKQQVDLWPFDLESGVRVTCDVGYLCANFSLPRPLCSPVRSDVRDRQTDRRQTKASLNASTLWGRGITSCVGSRAICPAHVRRTLQPSSSLYTSYACGAQRALLHEYSWSAGNGSITLGGSVEYSVVHINYVVT